MPEATVDEYDKPETLPTEVSLATEISLGARIHPITNAARVKNSSDEQFWLCIAPPLLAHARTDHTRRRRRSTRHRITIGKFPAHRFESTTRRAQMQCEP